MQIHPQLLKTVQLIEDLRRGRKDVTLTLEFGALGLESAVVDRQTTAQIEEIRRRARKALDNEVAKTIV